MEEYIREREKHIQQIEEIFASKYILKEEVERYKFEEEDGNDLEQCSSCGIYTALYDGNLCEDCFVEKFEEDDSFMEEDY